MTDRHRALARILNGKDLLKADIDILLVAFERKDLTISAMYVFRQLGMCDADWSIWRQQEKAEEICLPRIKFLKEAGYLTEVNKNTENEIYSTFKLNLEPKNN